jgi:hypothetical protein
MGHGGRQSVGGVVFHKPGAGAIGIEEVTLPLVIDADVGLVLALVIFERGARFKGRERLRHVGRDQRDVSGSERRGAGLAGNAELDVVVTLGQLQVRKAGKQRSLRG